MWFKLSHDRTAQGQSCGTGKRKRPPGAGHSNGGIPKSTVPSGLKQMDVEEAKAYFYDMHIAKMKAAGKEFSKGTGP